MTGKRKIFHALGMEQMLKNLPHRFPLGMWSQKEGSALSSFPLMDQAGFLFAFWGKVYCVATGIIKAQTNIIFNIDNFIFLRLGGYIKNIAGIKNYKNNKYCNLLLIGRDK